MSDTTTETLIAAIAAKGEKRQKNDKPKPTTLAAAIQCVGAPDKFVQFAATIRACSIKGSITEID